jgi:hypothetical protein
MTAETDTNKIAGINIKFTSFHYDNEKKNPSTRDGFKLCVCVCVRKNNMAQRNYKCLSLPSGLV